MSQSASLKDILDQVLIRRWRPKLGRTHSKWRRKYCKRSYQAWGVGRKYPVFEASVRGLGMRGPLIELMHYGCGGIGTGCEIDLEEADKLIMILLAARQELAFRYLKPEVK